MQLQTNHQRGPTNGSDSGQSSKMQFFRWGVDRAKSTGKTLTSAALTTTVVLTAADFAKNTALKKGDVFSAIAPTVNDVFNALSKFAGFFWNHPYLTGGAVLLATALGAIKAHVENNTKDLQPVGQRLSEETLAKLDDNISKAQSYLKTGLAAIGKAIKPLAVLLLGSDFIVGVTTLGWGAFGKVWADLCTAAGWVSDALLASPAVTALAILAIIGAKRYKNSRKSAENLNKEMEESAKKGISLLGEQVQLLADGKSVACGSNLAEFADSTLRRSQELFDNGKYQEAGQLASSARLMLQEFETEKIAQMESEGED